MDKASEALADVRGWLCDNLSAGDAGKICGMLSVVSRHIVALEEENAKLQKERDYLLHNETPTACEVRRVRSAMRHVNDENAKLRKLIQKAWKWERNGCYECPLEKDCKVLCVYDGDCGIAVEIEKELQELGIEVPHDN